MAAAIYNRDGKIDTVLLQGKRQTASIAWRKRVRYYAYVSSGNYNLNRPIHLARRDVHFERAVELLGQPAQALVTAERLTCVAEALERLQIAYQHATLAAQSVQVGEREPDFRLFLELVVHNVSSAHAMIQHQLHLEHEQGFLCRFLDATQEECALPALHYQRRADDILQGVWHLLRLAVPAFHHLKQASIEALPETEKGRYEKAYKSFRSEVLDQKSVLPAAP